MASEDTRSAKHGQKSYLWLGSELFGSKSLAQELGNTYGAAISDPNWDQIVQAVVQMNGEDLNEVSLRLLQKGEILIGGGNNGRYILVYFPKDEDSQPSLTLSDPSLDGPDVQLVISTSSEYPARICVRQALVLKVLEHYYRTGQMPKDVRWEIESSGKEATLL